MFGGAHEKKVSTENEKNFRRRHKSLENSFPKPSTQPAHTPQEKEKENFRGKNMESWYQKKKRELIIKNWKLST